MGDSKLIEDGGLWKNIIEAEGGNRASNFKLGSRKDFKLKVDEE